MEPSDMLGILIVIVGAVVVAALVALAAKLGYAFFMWAWVLMDRVMP